MNFRLNRQDRGEDEYERDTKNRKYFHSFLKHFQISLFSLFILFNSTVNRIFRRTTHSSSFSSLLAILSFRISYPRKSILMTTTILWRELDELVVGREERMSLFKRVMIENRIVILFSSTSHSLSSFSNFLSTKSMKTSE